MISDSGSVIISDSSCKVNVYCSCINTLVISHRNICLPNEEVIFMLVNSVRIYLPEVFLS